MRKSSFVEGTFIATFAIVLVKILGMLYVIPFYAIIGTEGATLYAYAYTIYNIFLDISTVGLPTAISKITKEYDTLGKQEAKVRAYHLAISFMRYLSVGFFIMLFLFAEPIAHLILGDLTGGSSIEDVTSVIRVISLAILVIPYLSVTKGFFQGHSVINISSISNILEQVVRIAVILIGSYVTIKVCGGSYVLGVEVALLGAFIGGLVAYLYIKWKMHKNKEELGLIEYKKQDELTNKEIIKKIASYAIPYVIINLVHSLYSFADMVLILRGLSFVGFSTVDAEYAATSASTWAGKINMIVTSIAMGMTISLIPAIVHSFVLEKWDQVNHKMNTALKMIIYISLPLATGLSLLSQEVWAIFYGSNQVGGTLLSLTVFVALVGNVYMIVSSILQSLNQFKTVYIATGVGFLLNVCLDVPMIILCSKVGIPAYLGASIASMIGYGTTALIGLISIKKLSKEIHYKDTILTILKSMIPLIGMIIVVLFIKELVVVDMSSKLSLIGFVALNAVVGGITFLGMSYLLHLFDDVFGKEQIEKFKKKLLKH